MKARKFPGVRCSTLKTECRSLLCLMIMPGRSWVAGMAIAKLLSLRYLRLAEGRCSHNCRCGLTVYFIRPVRIWELDHHWKSSSDTETENLSLRSCRQLKWLGTNPRLKIFC